MNKFILFMSLKIKIVKEVVLDTAPAEGGRRGQQAYTMSSRNYITQIEWETKNTGIYESILSLQCWKSLSFMCQKTRDSFFLFPCSGSSWYFELKLWMTIELKKAVEKTKTPKPQVLFPERARIF